MNKAWLVLLLLIPLCTAQENRIRCFGNDFLFVRNMELQCKSKVPQFCYTKANGDKGCTTQKYCQEPGWNCCNTDLCNA